VAVVLPLVDQSDCCHGSVRAEPSHTYDRDDEQS